MARVRPFRAWRYARSERDLSPVIAPPYDVITPEQRSALLDQDPYNAVALELPEGPLDPSVPGNRYETGADRWKAWRASGVLAQDETPAIYVMEQRYSIGGTDHARRALVVEVGLERFEDGIVLPHERTLPKALGDRFELTRATGANFSPVFALYSDPSRDVDHVVDAALDGDPIAEAHGGDGVVTRLWALTDPTVTGRIAELLADKRLFIADGHHRYTTALAYRDALRAAACGAETDTASDYVLMALVNMDDPDLVVLPTHRVVAVGDAFDAEAFWSGLSRYFEVSQPEPGHPGDALAALDRPGFLVHAPGERTPRVAHVRDDVDLDQVIAADHSTEWKQLDVAVLQELVLEPLLGIHPDEPETLERLTFVKDAHAASKQAAESDSAVAFLMRPTRLEQLRAVAIAGETMPQKSTYFHPKVPSGMLFRSAE